MADYEITADLILDDRGPVRGVDRVNRSLGRLESRAVSIERLFKTGLGLFGIGAGIEGVRQLTSSVGRLGASAFNARAEFESFETRIGGIALAVGQVQDAAQARGFGRSIIAQLNEDAARGVGELDNYVQTFSLLFQPLSATGAGAGRIRDITRLAIASGAAARGREGMQLAGIDVVQALAGNVNPRESQVVFPALQAAGIDVEAFRAADQTQRVALLEQAFGAFSGAADLFGQTFEAQADTLRDSIRQVGREAADLPFVRMKRVLMDVNGTIKRNDSLIADLGRGFGDAANGLIDIGTTIIGLDLDTAGRDLAAALQDAAERASQFGRAASQFSATVDGVSSGGSTGIMSTLADVPTDLLTGAAAITERLAFLPRVGLRTLDEFTGPGAPTFGQALSRGASTAAAEFAVRLDDIYNRRETLDAFGRRLDAELPQQQLPTRPTPTPTPPPGDDREKIEIEFKGDVRAQILDDGSAVVRADDLSRAVEARRTRAPRTGRQRLPVPGA